MADLVDDHPLIPTGGFVCKRWGHTHPSGGRFECVPVDEALVDDAPDIDLPDLDDATEGCTCYHCHDSRGTR